MELQQTRMSRHAVAVRDVPPLVPKVYRAAHAESKRAPRASTRHTPSHGGGPRPTPPAARVATVVGAAIVISAGFVTLAPDAAGHAVAALAHLVGR